MDIKLTANMTSINEPILNADFSTQCVIIGSGPAGGALASFLAQHGKPKIDDKLWICLTAREGITGMVISKTSSTARTPRAHTTNMATMGWLLLISKHILVDLMIIECLRDINLEDHLRKIGYEYETMPHNRFARSMVGEEFARVNAWGTGPHENARRFTKNTSIISNRRRVGIRARVLAST